MITKRQLLNRSLSLAGFDPNVFSISPNEFAELGFQMDMMVLSWGVNIGYVLSGNSDDLSLDHKMPLDSAAIYAIVCNTALMIDGIKGRQAPQKLINDAGSSLSTLYVSLALPKALENPLPISF